METGEEVRLYVRVDAVARLIEEAIGVYNAGGFWPIALTLARAAASYLSERLNFSEKQGAMKAIHGEVQANLSMSMKLTELKDVLVGAADLFSHYNPRTSTDEVAQVTATNVEAVIFFAIADFEKLTGGVTAPMRAWVLTHFARPEVAAYKNLEPGSDLHRQMLADGEALFGKMKK